MICTPSGGTFVPGDSWRSNFRFTRADGRRDERLDDRPLTVAAQTVGGKKNNGTTLQDDRPVLTNLVAERRPRTTPTCARNENAATGNLSSTVTGRTSA